MTAFRFLIIIVALLCGPLPAAVRIVESTPSRVVLDWELGGFDAVSVRDSSGAWTRVSFDGGYAVTGDSGAALLPGYSIYAGIPQLGSVRVSVVPEEVASVRVADPLQRRDFPVRQGEPAFASRSGWASEPSYTAFRDYRSALIVLRPVADLGAGRVRLLKRARIIIDISPAPHSGASWELRDDYERMVKGLLVNFNTAQGWQGGRRGMRKIASAGEPYPFDVNHQRLATFKVGDGHRNEAATNKNSLIRISGASVRKIFGGDVPINSVALYASVKGEINVLVPPDTSGGIPAGVFEIPLLRYDLNENGMVDDGDYFIAYVSGASDWAYGSRQFSFAPNRYSDYRTYWLAVKSGAGVSMGRFDDAPAASGAVLESFENNQLFRAPTSLSNTNNEGGLDWTWIRFSPSRADTTIRLNLFGLDAARPASVQFRPGRVLTPQDAVGRSRPAINASLGQNTVCTSCRGNEWIEIDNWGEAENFTVRYSDPALEAKSHYELNAIQLRYGRRLEISESAGKLEIFSETASDAARYKLAKSSGGAAYVVRVPVNERDVTLIGKFDEPEIVWTDVGNRGVRYMATLEKEIVDYSDSLTVFTRRPTTDGRYQIRDLRNPPGRTDYLIITHEDFLEASLKLAEHKANAGFNHPKVVLLGDVFDQFGGGNTDPAAIRNFLLYIYRGWDGGDAFSYVLLVGSGHYDYRNIGTRAVNFMPVPYIGNRISDDFYVFFNTEIHPSSQHEWSYFLGRLPAKSATDAFNMVEKIIEMEDPRVAEFDAWRNRALMVSDDDQQGADKDKLLDHHEQLERITQIVEKNRPDVDIKRLHLFEHEWDERYFKPGATRTFINEINNGVAAVNWFGHGGISMIADERLFTKEDITALFNRKRYPLITLFSCSIGKFDQPGNDCLAELLVKQSGAGAIASISGARETYPDANERLALPFYDALYDPEFGTSPSLGSALKTAKHRSTVVTADNRYYVLLGDPSIKLINRNREVTLTIADTAGTKLDTLKALQQITIKGTVQDPAGHKDGDFGGMGAFVNITLFNPPQDSARRKDGGKFTNPVYKLTGSPVFSAKIPVANGEFEQKLLLPMNLGFGKPGAKLLAYAWKADGAATGSGHLGGLIFEGSESGNVSDTSGPKISVRPVYNTAAMDQAGLFVKNRVTAQLPLTLEVSVEDESGINVIGTGPDEGLTMEVKGTLSKRSINHQLQFSEGSFKQGTAALIFEENSLRSGIRHELVISAQDLLGNVSKLSVMLDIVDPADLKLDHVINVPNPVKMGKETRFYYHHSDAPGDLDVRVTIRVYTLGGRLLTVIRAPQNGHPWIPADQKGNLLTPNVYLYQVTATSPNIGKTVKSKIKKLVVHPPR